MRSTRRSLGVASVVFAGALAAIAMTATTASAQQLTDKRLARSAGTPPMMAATTIEARLARASDSVAYYMHEARVQRVTGGSLVGAGLAAVAVAWARYSNSSENMGMTGAQGAIFVGGAALSLVGGTRLVMSRESYASAAQWNQVRVAAAAERTPSPSTTGGR